MKTSVESIVGPPAPGRWSQVAIFRPPPEEPMARSIPLFVVLDLSGPADFEAAALGRETLEAVKESFYQEKSTVFEALKIALGEALGRLEEIVAKMQEEEGVEFNIAAAAPFENVLYLACLGGAKAYFWRQKLGLILGEPTEDVKVASGEIKPGDIAILTTPAFAALVTNGELTAALAGGDIRETTDALAPKIHGAQTSPTAAAAFLKFEEEKPQVEEEEARLPTKRPHPIYLHQIEKVSHRPKKWLLAALVLAGLLTLSIIKGTSRRSYFLRRAQLETLIESAEDKYKKGVSLADINPLMSRSFLLEAQKTLAEASDLKIKSQKLTELEKRIATQLLKVSRIYELGKLAPFFDLNIIKEGLGGRSLGKIGDQLLILDSVGSSIYSLDVNNKSSQVLAGKENLGARFLATFAERIYVFAPQEGIFEVKEKGLHLVIAKESAWGEMRAMATYGGNIYLLDTTNNQILKFVGTESGFSPSFSFLKASEVVNFSQATDLAIDGAIYVIQSDGTVLKYLLGESQPFSLSGLDKPFSGKPRLYADPEAQYLYVLDRPNGRIVVFNKTGDYISQYESESLSQANDFLVDEEEKAMYILAKDKIYRIELR